MRDDGPTCSDAVGPAGRLGDRHFCERQFPQAERYRRDVLGHLASVRGCVSALPLVGPQLGRGYDGLDESGGDVVDES
jgi:hypothetical protein